MERQMGSDGYKGVRGELALKNNKKKKTKTTQTWKIGEFLRTIKKHDEGQIRKTKARKKITQESCAQPGGSSALDQNRHQHVRKPKKNEKIKKENRNETPRWLDRNILTVRSNYRKIGPPKKNLLEQKKWEELKQTS